MYVLKWFSKCVNSNGKSFEKHFGIKWDSENWKFKLQFGISLEMLQEK